MKEIHNKSDHNSDHNEGILREIRNRIINNHTSVHL